MKGAREFPKLRPVNQKYRLVLLYMKADAKYFQKFGATRIWLQNDEKSKKRDTKKEKKNERSSKKKKSKKQKKKTG